MNVPNMNRSLQLDYSEKYRFKTIEKLLGFAPVLAFFDSTDRFFGVSPLEIMVLGISIVLCIGILVGIKKIVVPFKKGYFGAFAFAVIAMFSFFFNEVYYSETDGQIRALIGQWYIRGLFVYLLLYGYRNKWLVLRQIKGMVLANIIAVALSTCIVIMTSDIMFFRSTVLSFKSPFYEIVRCTSMSNPNVLGRFLVVTFPYAFIYFLQKGNYHIYVLFVLNLFIVICTFSRMSLIIYLLEFLFLFSFVDHSSTRKLILLLLGSLLIYTFSQNLAERINQKTNQIKTYGTTLRIEMLKASLNALKERPLLGYGAGSSMAVINRYSKLTFLCSKIKGREYQLSQHNTLVLIATEVGYIGLAVYLIMFILLFCRGFSLALKTKAATYRKKLNYVILLSSISYFCAGFTAVNFGENIGWVAIAMLVYTINNKKINI